MTTVSTDAPAQAFYLRGSAGNLFAIYHPASNPEKQRHDVILLPPFAEEMNKSRRMLSLQAREFARQGIGAMLLDLFGTGESQGEFGDARWAIWKEDVEVACAWLRAHGATRIGLLGLRLGAVLAMDCAREQERNLAEIVLWQPVVNGATAMTQFLRLRLAAEMLADGGNRGSVQNLRQVLNSGQLVEVAGYDLAPDLVAAVDALRLDEMAVPSTAPVHWLELVAESEHGLAPASQRVLQAWKAKGVNVRAVPVIGPAFWSTTEVTLAPDLLRVTSQIVESAGKP